MCGIAGIINISKNHFEVDEKHLFPMQEKIAHRGPNGFGIWKSDDKQVGLAHRRLSIIDLSSAANQPMEDRSGYAVISFNGEIYNHLELRKELETCGHTYFSNSDTETILYAYAQWGIECINRLDGEFAFALYDKQTKELFLVRDRIGVKPIYFSVMGGVLSFASEIKALWSLPWINKEISFEALYHYLTFMISPPPITMYSGIYKLPAGFYLKVDANKNIVFCEWYSPINYNSIIDTKNLSNEQFCIENIQRLLRDSVKKRMIADVPVGVFLSGGIDSSLNVALMAEHQQKINTYTIAFSDEPKSDERAFAKKIADKYSTNHHEIEISEKEAFEFFEQMLYQHDEPLADCVSIPLYYVSKKASDSGIKVVQLGEGADELFFGYPLYSNYAKFFNSAIHKHGNYIPKFVKSFIFKLSTIFLKNKNAHQEFLFNWANSKPTFWSGAIAFGEKQKKEFITAQNISNESIFYNDPIINKIFPALTINLDSSTFINFYLNKLFSKIPSADFGTQITYLELKQRIPELLLMRADKMLMAASIEGRLPYLDYKLVEFVMQIPINLKFKNNETKYLLKKACRGILPHEIISRKKMGFGAPTSWWFSSGKYFPKFFEEKKQIIADSLKNNFIDWKSAINKNSSNIGVQKWTIQNLSNLTNKKFP